MKCSTILIFAFAFGCKVSSTPPPAQPPAEPSFQEQAKQKGLLEESANTWMTRDIVGKSCRVSLRRDALGMSAPGFAEPMTPMIGGNPALLMGTVDKLTDSWLVLRNKSKTYWIPVNAILMVETESK